MKRILLHLLLTAGALATAIVLSSCAPIGAANPLDQADAMPVTLPGGTIDNRPAVFTAHVPPVVPGAPCTVATPGGH